ncbi:protein FAM188A [Pitangus sulphuratus]|nr:protein FAM188A [Pitangus sulphuratus]
MSEPGQELLHLVWGKKAGPRGLADTIFCRWAQDSLTIFCCIVRETKTYLIFKGFVFSDSESTALEQFEGGPCAVIAPVQGIENIKNEIEDATEPLIDPVYGHGSQSLINLLLTGHAVSNVWDGDRECSGMKLLGIHKQATVGFLTLMESLRYCKVGSYLKSPKFPIWILGSETHLTVFFAKDMVLVAPEAPSEQARRVFQTYDPEDNGFIPDTLLEDVMKALDLVSDPEYVNLMKTKLDPEGLGIILLGPFLQEFFPEQDSRVSESFTVYHYNGLKQSNYNEKVMYVEGTAVVMGFEEPMLQTDDTPVKRCLQTKWPYIELLWTTDRSPSLN